MPPMDLQAYEQSEEEAVESDEQPLEPVPEEEEPEEEDDEEASGESPERWRPLRGTTPAKISRLGTQTARKEPRPGHTPGAFLSVTYHNTLSSNHQMKTVGVIN